MLRRLHQAGRPVPMITNVYVGGSPAFSTAEIKAASPRTVVFARDLRGNDYHADDIGGWNNATRAHGRAYFEANKVLIGADMLLADYIIMRDVNEPGEGTGTNAWWQGMLDGADAFTVNGAPRPLHLGLYQFSYGNPNDLGFWRWSSTVELLRRAKRGGHALCLHQYADNDNWLNDWTILRHRRIWPLLPADLRDIKLWMTECGESYMAPGTPSDRSVERYGQRLQTLQAALTNDPGDPDAAMWTLGNGGDAKWDVDRLEGILGMYEQLVMRLAL